MLNEQQLKGLRKLEAGSMSAAEFLVQMNMLKLSYAELFQLTSDLNGYTRLTRDIFGVDHRELTERGVAALEAVQHED